MAEQHAGQEPEIPIDSLLARVKAIESVRKSQSLLRLACLGIVFGLIGLTGVTVYGSYKSLDGAKYAANLQKELHQEFQPDLETLAREGQHKLLPDLANHLKASLEKRLPLIQQRYEKLATAKIDEVEEKFDRSVLVYFREFENELRQALPEEDMRLAFYKMKRSEDLILQRLEADLRKQMDNLRPKIDRMQRAIERIGSDPNVRGLSYEQAKDQLIESAIDLLKYEILPEKGGAQ